MFLIPIGGGFPPFPKTTFLGGEFPYVLVPTNTFTDVFDNTCDIGEFREHMSALGRLKNYADWCLVKNRSRTY